MTQEIQTDIAIIGAGPVGLFAVFQCGMLGMRCHVLDSLPDLGGQCSALYPEKPIYDIPGFPQVEGAALIARLEAQAAPFAPTYHLGHQVVKLIHTEGHGFRLESDKGLVLHAKAVIIAAGGGAFGPNRPPLDGLEDYEGRSVHYMVRNRHDFAGKRIVIAGGGDSAVDWTLSLQEVAAHITLVHRRDKFKAAPDNVAKLRALAASGAITLAIPTQLHGLEGDRGHLRAVHLVDEDGAPIRVEADILLPFYGLAASLGPIADWGLDHAHGHIPVDPLTCETTQGGIYAIGDIATYPHKLKLILTGFAEGAQAAHAAWRRLYPDQALHFEYSTTKGVPDGSASDNVAPDRIVALGDKVAS